MRLTPLASALVVLCSLGALAQQPPSTAQRPATAPPPASGQPPITFRVEIDYVELDAIVTDAQGRPVRNLTREDFQVFEEGQPQTVTNFSQVDLPLERPDAPLFVGVRGARLGPRHVQAQMQRLRARLGLPESVLRALGKVQ